MDTRRFARHLNLEGVGAQGQERLLAGTARVHGEGEGAWVARRYLEAGGVGEVLAGEGDAQEPAWVREQVADEACREVIAGSLQALDALRALLAGRDP